MENIKHCYIAIGLLYLSNQEKNSKVSGSEKSCAVAEVQKITANVPQTCGFADHLLLFCGICGCEIEFKFAVPSTRWNFAGSRCVPRDEKVADPCCKVSLLLLKLTYALSF